MKKNVIKRNSNRMIIKMNDDYFKNKYGEIIELNKNEKGLWMGKDKEGKTNWFSWCMIRHNEYMTIVEQYEC